MLSWKQDKLLIQAAQGEFLHTLNPNTPFQLEADLIHPPQRKVRYLFLFWGGGKEREKKSWPHQPFTKGMSRDVIYLGSDFSVSLSFTFSHEKVEEAYMCVMRWVIPPSP